MFVYASDLRSRDVLTFDMNILTGEVIQLMH